jgi:hypothetical protein
MEKKWLLWVLIGAIVVVGGSMFWTGRTSGRSSMEGAISDLERDVEKAAAERDAAMAIVGQINELLGDVATELGNLRGGFEQFGQSVSGGIDKLGESIEANRELYIQYAESSAETQQYADEFREYIESGLDFIESVEEGVPPDAD